MSKCAGIGSFVHGECCTGEAWTTSFWISLVRHWGTGKLIIDVYASVHVGSEHARQLCGYSYQSHIHQGHVTSSSLVFLTFLPHHHCLLAPHSTRLMPPPCQKCPVLQGINLKQLSSKPAANKRAPMVHSHKHPQPHADHIFLKLWCNACDCKGETCMLTEHL